MHNNEQREESREGRESKGRNMCQKKWRVKPPDHGEETRIKMGEVSERVLR